MDAYDPTDPTGVDALPPSLLANRDDKFAKLPVLRRLDKQQYDWAYKYICKRSFRLLGLPATVYVSPPALAAAMRKLLLSDESEDVRTAGDRAEIRGVVSCKPEEHTEAMVFFSFLIADDLRRTDVGFARLVEKIRGGELVFNGNVLRLVKQTGPLPLQKPHDKILESIPDMLQALADQAENAEVDAGDAVLVGNEAKNDVICGMAIPTAAAVCAGTADPAILAIVADPALIIPKPFGALDNGVRSVVVAPPQLTTERQSLDRKLQALVQFVSTKSSWHCKVTNEGAFVFAKTKDFQLGIGSETRVYLALFLKHRSEHDKYDDNNREPIQAAIGRGVPVAIKIFGHSSNKLEVSMFRSTTMKAGGLLKSIDLFEYEDELCLVQEVALTTLKAWVGNNRLRCDVDKLFQFIRAACLALFELHGREEGAIWHRDIRLSNFLVATDGSLKLGDYGFSRSVSSYHMDVRKLELLPAEIQVIIQNLINSIDEEPNEFALPFSERADIFMLGMVLFEIFTGRKAMSRSDILARRVVDLRPVLEVRSTGSSLLAHLLSKMLSHEEEERPTIREVLLHPFFRSWNENYNTVDYLYKSLHAGRKPVLNDTLRLLCDVFCHGESKINSGESLDGLPNSVKRIAVGKAPPVMDPKTETEVPHPLPNTHRAVVWLRHFMTHFSDTANLSHFYDELMDFVQQGDVGAFIYCHPAVNWILPYIWDCRQEYHLRGQAAQIQIERDFEAARLKYEEDMERFKSDRRKADDLYGVRSF